MKISIYRDGVWEGTGKLVGGYIEDCAAMLADTPEATEAVYEAIENAIADGDDSEARDGDGIKVGGKSYSWTLE